MTSGDGAAGSGSSSGLAAGPEFPIARGEPPDKREPEGHQAPRYTNSTPRPQGKVDIVITVRSDTFNHSVGSRITEGKLHRIAANETRTNLEGFKAQVD
jgi:hypothetical protein